jgi:hypothetical protein
MLWSLTQSFNLVSIEIFCSLRIFFIIDLMINSVLSHLLIKLLNIDISVFSWWSINEKTQLNDVNSSMKCVIQKVSLKSNLFLKMIISKCKISYDLITRSAKIFCIKRCILLTAHVSQLIVFENSFFLIISILSIFFNWWMISSLQWSSLRCQNHDVVFVVVNFLDWMLRRAMIKKYTSKNVDDWEFDVY